MRLSLFQELLKTVEWVRAAVIAPINARAGIEDAVNPTSWLALLVKKSPTKQSHKASERRNALFQDTRKQIVRYIP